MNTAIVITYLQSIESFQIMLFAETYLLSTRRYVVIEGLLIYSRAPSATEGPLAASILRIQVIPIFINFVCDLCVCE